MRFRSRVVLTVETAAAAGIAYQLATIVSHNRNPYFAPLAVVLTLQMTLADTFRISLYRAGGIVGGVLIAMVASLWVQPGALGISLVVLAGMTLAMALHLHPLVTSQVCITALLVLIARDNYHYALDRIYETVLGSVVGIGLHALVPTPEPEAESHLKGR
ncbi:MAG: FUSC family protein [Mycobacterium leprae]